MKEPVIKTARRRDRDAQLEEFENRDLGNDIRASGVRPVVIRPKSRPTSIVLEPDLIERLPEGRAKLPKLTECGTLKISGSHDNTQ